MLNMFPLFRILSVQFIKYLHIYLLFSYNTYNLVFPSSKSLFDCTDPLIMMTGSWHPVLESGHPAPVLRIPSPPGKGEEL